VQFLRRHKAFLAGHGAAPSADGALNEDALIRVLACPPDDGPEDLLDGLFFTNEVAAGGPFDELAELAEKNGVAVSKSDSHADLALRVWMADPVALQSFHADRLIDLAEELQIVRGKHPGPRQLPATSDADVRAIEDDLDRWFADWPYGHGTRVFVFDRDPGKWLLIRRDDPLVRVGALEDGESVPLAYHPEQLDVVLYNSFYGSIGINTNRRRSLEAYCTVLGRHFFGDEDYYDPDQPGKPFALRPIVEHGEAALTCRDVSHVEKVRLVDMEVSHQDGQFHVDHLRADDVLDALKYGTRGIPGPSRLTRATFDIQLADEPGAHQLTIDPPNRLRIDPALNVKPITEWMRYRGFALPTHTGQDADAWGPLDAD
jgi:hypothetical protein